MNRGLVYGEPGPLGDSLGRVLFEACDATGDGRLIVARERGGQYIGQLEELQRLGYIRSLERLGRSSARFNLTEKGRSYGAKHFGWSELL